MPERKKLRLDIVRYLLERGARSAEASVDAMDHFLGTGVRSRDYAEAIADLISLRIVAREGEGTWVTRDGEDFVGPQEAPPQD